MEIEWGSTDGSVGNGDPTVSSPRILTHFDIMVKFVMTGGDVFTYLCAPMRDGKKWRVHPVVGWEVLAIRISSDSLPQRFILIMHSYHAC